MSDTRMRDAGLLVLRLAGATFATHGYAKIFTEKGVPTGDVEAHGLPLPEVLAWAAALTELGGGILVLVGIYTRVSATFCAITMAVAAFVIHGDDGFGMMEFALVYLLIFVTLALTGPGRYSGDAQWRKKT